MRILLVDDDGALRRVLRRLLEAMGMEVVAEAADGQEALTALEQVGVDLILSDLQMPQMDGIAMTRALRQAGNHTPVIMLSGQGDTRAIVAAIRAGVDNYVPKPVSAELLLEKIQQTLGATSAV